MLGRALLLITDVLGNLAFIVGSVFFFPRILEYGGQVGGQGLGFGLGLGLGFGVIVSARWAGSQPI